MAPYATTSTIRFAKLSDTLASLRQVVMDTHPNETPAELVPRATSPDASLFFPRDHAVAGSRRPDGINGGFGVGGVASHTLA
jgi:hypothetical protein